MRAKGNNAINVTSGAHSRNFDKAGSCINSSHRNIFRMTNARMPISLSQFSLSMHATEQLNNLKQSDRGRNTLNMSCFYVIRLRKNKKKMKAKIQLFFFAPRRHCILDWSFFAWVRSCYWIFTFRGSVYIGCLMKKNYAKRNFSAQKNLKKTKQKYIFYCKKNLFKAVVKFCNS